MSREAGAAPEVHFLIDREVWLLQIAELLLSEDEEKTPEILLTRLLEALGAERGFIVVRDRDSYEQKFHVHFDRAQLTNHERSFSRTLVRKAIETQQILYSPNVAKDPRFASVESAEWIGESCVLVAPLRHDGKVYGVVYLERRGSADSFGQDAQRLVAKFADLAGLFIRRALERESLRQRNLSLERDLFSRHNFPGILTRDPRMLDLLQTVAQIADSEATVLICGETGTGKELVARAVHLNSSRKNRPFITVHCTALPGTLLDSELFGHTKGAFTGAHRDRPGRFAAADGATLFLDEIAEIPLEVQAKLLRFLQFGEVQRLGSDRTESLDVRVLAATHQDLPALVQAGRFRQDLYYRINVLELRIPPLRERRQDIPVLVEDFIRRYWKRAGEKPEWNARALQALECYEFPGNVRELEHIVERACLLARGPELSIDLLPPSLVQGLPSSPPSLMAESANARTKHQPLFRGYTNDELKSAKETAAMEVEERFLAGLMAACAGNVSRAARQAGVPRSHLQRMLARHRSSSRVPTDDGDSV